MLTRFFLFTLGLMLSSSYSVQSSEEFKDKADEEMYKQGLEHRNAKKTQMAIDCFLPLARKGYVKAQHNLAMQYLDQGNDLEAYGWFKSASDQGFEPSSMNLGRMNLLFLLLPDEMLSKVVSHLPMKDLLIFASVSGRAQKIVDDLIVSTNYLATDEPYARDINAILKDVEFTPKPQSIRMRRFAISKDYAIEVHFRDNRHLDEIVDRTPAIRAKGKTYFVYDEHVKDGHELVVGEGKVEQGYFIHVMADEPLHMKGKFYLPFPILLPEKSDINGLTRECKGRGITIGEPGAYRDAQSLIAIRKSFNEELYKTKTSDAHSILEERRKSRLDNPELYPDLRQLCPNACLLSGFDIEIQQKDFIDSASPLVYMANSRQEIENLKVKLPKFNDAVNYIEPHRKNPGIYSEEPLLIEKGFELHSEGHMTISGEIPLQDYNVAIRCNKSLWLLGAQLKAKNISFSIAGITYMQEFPALPLTEKSKPANMPQEEWERFVSFLRQNGRIQ